MSHEKCFMHQKGKYLASLDIFFKMMKIVKKYEPEGI